MVYIGVIHPYHLSTCLLFTNAKKNVLCEKPLAMNTKEVREILGSAKRNDVFLMEVPWSHQIYYIACDCHVELHLNMECPSCPLLKGCLVQILPGFKGDKTTTCPGGSGWGENGEGRLLCSSGQREEISGQDSGWRSNPGSWHLLLAIRVHGV